MATDALEYANNWVDFLDELIEECVQNVLLAIEDGLEAAGPRPFGMVRGNITDQLEAYYAFRDDPSAWATILMDWEQKVGRKAAEVYAIREADRLERLSETRGGPLGVMAELVLRSVTEQRRALAEANRIRNAPPFTVLPPAPVVSPLDVLGGGPEPDQFTGVEELGPAVPADAPAADPLALQFISRRRAGNNDVAAGEPPPQSYVVR